MQTALWNGQLVWAQTEAKKAQRTYWCPDCGQSERIGARTVVKKFIYVREPITVPILRIMPKADVMPMKPLFISWVSSRLAGG